MSSGRLRPTEHDVRTSVGTLRVNLWEPMVPAAALTIVTVHPWAPLGGSEANTLGVARTFAESGVRALSFDMSSSSMVWGVLTNHGREVKQVTDLCNWAKEQWPTSDVLLFGSSAGSPQAGSVLDRCSHVVGIACVGYTWGALSSIAFGRHYSSFLKSTKPKLLITGDRDEFTSVSVLESYVTKAHTGTVESVVIKGAGHFELEMPAADGLVVGTVVEWIKQRGWWLECDHVMPT